MRGRELHSSNRSDKWCKRNRGGWGRKGGATNLKGGGSMHWKVGSQYSKTPKLEKGGRYVTPPPASMVAPHLDEWVSRSVEETTWTKKTGGVRIIVGSIEIYEEKETRRVGLTGTEGGSKTGTCMQRGQSTMLAWLNRNRGSMRTRMHWLIDSSVLYMYVEWWSLFGPRHLQEKQRRNWSVGARMHESSGIHKMFEIVSCNWIQPVLS